MLKFIHEVGTDGRVAMLARTFCEILKLDKIELWYDSAIKSYIIEYIAADGFDSTGVSQYIVLTIQALQKYDALSITRTQT